MCTRVTTSTCGVTSRDMAGDARGHGIGKTYSAVGGVRGIAGATGWALHGVLVRLRGSVAARWG